MGNVLLGSLVLVEQGTQVVVERLGQYSRTLSPGLHFLSLIERCRTVNWRFQNHEPNTLESFQGCRIPVNDLCYNPAEIECSTRDGVKIQVDVVLYFSICNAKAAVYSVTDLFQMVENKVLTSLYSTVRSLSVEQVSPEEINLAMNVAEISSEAEKWGVKIGNFFVQRITLPREIEESTVRTIGSKRKAEAELDKIEDEHRRKIKMAKITMDEQMARLNQENQEKDNRRAQELAELKHRLDSQRLENDSALAIERESHEAKIEQLKLKNRAEVEMSLQRRQTELDLLFKECQIVTQNPDSRSYGEKKLLLEAWSRIATSANSKVILAPLDTLELASRQPVAGPSLASSALIANANGEDASRISQNSVQ
jgi:regulator of protease activity HflC (stomatin/prohibitin superfamily)